MEDTQGRAWVALLVALMVMAGAELAAGEIYKYTDKNGTECFTDDIQTVPDEHRRAAVKVYQRQEDPGSQRNRSKGGPDEDEAREGGGPEQGEASDGKNMWSKFSGSGVAHAGAVVVAFLAASIITGRAFAALGHKHVGSVIRIGLFLLVLLYLFSSHARDMAAAYTSLKEQVMSIKEIKERNDAQVRKTADESAPEHGEK